MKGVIFQTNGRIVNKDMETWKHIVQVDSDLWLLKCTASEGTVGFSPD